MELLVYAEKLMCLADEMQYRVRNRPAVRQVLRLGAADSFALTCLPGLLRRLERVYPDFQVELLVDHSVNLSRKLNARELDMAFLVNPQVDDHVIIESLCAIPLIWIAGASHGLPSGVLRPGHLQTQQILTLPAPSTSYTIIEDWFARADLRPIKMSTCNSMNMIVSLALKNCGISVVPKCIVFEELRSGLVKRINAAPELPSHSLFVAYQQTRFKAGLREVARMGREEIAIQEAFRETSARLPKKVAARRPRRHE